MVIATLEKHEHAGNKTKLVTPWTGIAIATACIVVITLVIGIILWKKCSSADKSLTNNEQECTANYKSNDGGVINIVAVTDNEYYEGGGLGEVNVPELTENMYYDNSNFVDVGDNDMVTKNDYYEGGDGQTVEK